MSTLFAIRPVLMFGAAALLAACGGGESPRTAAQTFTEALASSPAPAKSDRLRALSAGSGSTAAAAGPLTNDQLFRGAEAIFPQYFPTRPAPTTIDNLAYQGRVFQVKAYGNGNYLGIASDGTLWGLGPYTGDVLTTFGTVQSYADQVCAAINCGGNPGGGSGTLNGCTTPASEALRTGNRFSAVYVSNVLVAPTSTGEYTITGLVDGPTAFEGQSTIKVTSTIKGLERGQAVDVTSFAYEQVADNDLTRTLGHEGSMMYGTFAATTRTVFGPPDLNTEFTLAQGQSLTKTVSATTSILIPGSPVQLPPTTASAATTYTYEGRESISVLGRSYDTCRYKSFDPTTSTTVDYTWYIVGRGFAARMESRTNDGTVQYRTDLKSASINGAAL
ncbi:MAG: hypothetical protein IT501_12760 [Rubrivivax sp.]|nr:hypothetical protein [Rubrivivax sp.]